MMVLWLLCCLYGTFGTYIGTLHLDRANVWLSILINIQQDRDTRTPNLLAEHHPTSTPPKKDPPTQSRETIAQDGAHTLFPCFNMSDTLGGSTSALLSLRR